MYVRHTISSRLRNFFDDRYVARDFLPYAIGKRVAFLLMLPEDTNELQTFYNNNCERKVSTIVSTINEKFYFNIQEALKTTYVIWNTRCQLLFNPDSIDFLTMMESVKTGLVSPVTINRLYALLEKDTKLNKNTIIMLENLISEEITNGE